MNQEILTRLNRFFGDAPFLQAGGVSSSAIQEAEDELGVHFSEDYREFLRLYGGAIVGPYAVYGLARSEPMDERVWSVVDVTKQFRRQSWPGTEKAYVVSMDHAGNPICIDESGRATSFDHDAGELIEVSPDFAGYLEKCLT